MELKLKDLYDGFREPKVIKHFASTIADKSKNLKEKMYVMEVCGGHTHTIMKYGLNQILPETIEFVHGPGCPVCVMPKERINNAIELSKIDDVILVTLGDMIRVPASNTSLAQERANGADIRALYSPLDAIKIAKENPTKRVVFFAIGFETTTPMSASVIQKCIEQNIKNLYFHINHVLVPPAISAVMDSGDSLVNSFIAPSHVSVITGAKIYKELSSKYNTPFVVAGFEPVDVLQSIDMLVDMRLNSDNGTKIEYSRFVSDEGNIKAQQMIAKYMETRDSFRWRGLGSIPNSALKLRDEYAHLDAEVVFGEYLSDDEIPDEKMCICADILKGKSKPNDCKVFKKVCTPNNPLGSCMVSSEGACNAYYKYGL
jgi:hydrogenase expression/formation protein HypD